MQSTPAINTLMRGAAPLFASTTDDLQEPMRALELSLHEISGPETLGELCAELFRAGGKRLRPLACLASAQDLGLESAAALVLAEISERTHASALLHDDVIDEADTRRGKIAARRRWNNTLSVLGGDYLLIQSLRMLDTLQAPKLHAFYLDTIEDLLASEALQHTSKRAGDIAIEGYLRIAEGKTGSLFGFACAAPAMLLDNEKAAKALDRYGRDMGIAFQIADDLRDLLATDPGKPAALDLFDGIANLPLRCAASVDKDVAIFIAEAQQQRPNLDLVSKTIERVRATGAVDQAVKIGQQHLQRSRKELNSAAPGIVFQAHLGVIDWLSAELQAQAAL